MWRDLLDLVVCVALLLTAYCVVVWAPVLALWALYLLARKAVGP